MNGHSLPHPTRPAKPGMMTPPWKSNPSRARKVRPVLSIRDDGSGELRYEVADRSGASLGFTSHIWSPLSSAPSFKRNTREQRWADATTLERPSDMQVRYAHEWGASDVFDIGDLQPWAPTVEDVPAESPLRVDLREP